VAEKGQFPQAYLRIDPNLDSTHPAPGDMVALLCAANRQPRRGFFKSPELARRVLGQPLYRRCIERGDLKVNGVGVYVDGWAEWQEGDLNVGERMRRLRERRRNSDRNADRNGGVTDA
jgi:hypothetical protein